MNEEKKMPESAEWAIVEILGHLRTAGRISEEDRFGSKLLRVDRPYKAKDDEIIWVTAYHTGSVIYQLRFCSEETAREVAQSLGDPRPHSPSAPAAYLTFAPDDDDDSDDDRPF